MPGFELVGEEERAAVNEIFDEGGILFRHGFDTLRKNGRFRVVEFEEAFADYVGSGDALAVSSGTAALKTGLKALGIQPGDEVITQAFTFIATVEAIVDVGAIPVVVNVDDTLNMDPDDLERHITPKTRAIIPVPMLGVSPRMDQIMPIARENNLLVLEDNCESLGATYDGRFLGTFGDMGAFSFDFGKVITTGEGGMLVSTNPEYIKLAREYHDHGHENNPKLPRGRDTHRIFGFNYRIGELQAAVGLAQLRKLNYIVDQNRAHHKTMKQALRQIEGLRFRAIPPKSDSLCDTLILELPTAELASEFVARMGAVELGTKNLPDAIEWHFAGYWDHIFNLFDMNKQQLWDSLYPSYARLSRCVALPIMVKYTSDRIDFMIDNISRIADDLL